MAAARHVRAWITVPAMVVLLAGSLLLGSCSSGDTSGRGELSITFTPNPVTAGSDGTWEYKVYLREVNGEGVTILGYTIARYDADGGFTDMNFYTAGDFGDYFGCDSVASYLPGGLQACTEELSFGGSPGYQIWSFNGRDDKGNLVTASARVTLN